MTNNKPNCSTCTNVTCWLCKGNRFYDKVMSFPNTIEIREHREDIGIYREHVTLYGCLDHPEARAWLMKDVIVELEKEMKTAYKEITHVYIDQDAYRHGLAWMSKKATTLIKDGVKKE